MSKASWYNVREEMQTVEKMMCSPVINTKPDREIIDCIQRRLAISYIAAWRRLNRYRTYQTAIKLGKTEYARRIGWN